jgi:hypothetical protein
VKLNHRLQTQQPQVRVMTMVLTARAYARRIVEGEARATGQPVKEVAKHVATRLKQPYGSIWALLFRSPKSVSADLLLALQEAVEKQLRGEIQALENELLAVRLGALRRDAGALAEIEEGIARLRSRLRTANGEGA